MSGYCDGCGNTICVCEMVVRDAAGRVFKPAGVDIWMQAPNPWLNNATPMQFIRAGDVDRVLDVIAGLAEGVTG